MNLLRYLSQLPWVEPLGWTLIHFLWQGAVIGLVISVVLRLKHRASPNTRYALSIAAMLLCFIAPIVTFVALAKPFQHPVLAPRVLTNASEQATAVSPSHALTVQPLAIASSSMRPAIQPTATTSAIEELPKPQTFYVTWNVARWSVAMWFCGVIAAAMRLGVSWCRVQGWKRRSEPSGVSVAWLDDAFLRLARRMNISANVRLLISREIAGPLTLGFIRPVVILPFSILSGIPRDHLEAILAHELAHIRRHDYLVNLLQSAVEVILFYHPAVWWIGKRLREIREECCDDLASGFCSGRLAYAKALTALEEFRASELAPALGADGGSLLNRIKRLFGREEPEAMLSGRNAAWFTALGMAMITAACLIYSTVIAAEEKVALEKPAPSGIVTDETGHPVANAKVWVYYVKSEWGLGNHTFEETTSGNDGHFAFKSRLPFEVPNGTSDSDHYYLLASKPGKASAWTVITSGAPDPAIFSLVLTPPKSQSFEVVDLKGKPVKGARVWVFCAASQQNPQLASFSTPEDSGFASATTDDLGHATLELPKTGRNNIAVSCPGYEDESQCITPARGIPRFVLKPEATLEGRVTDPLGLPVEGAVVWLFPKFSYWQFFQARTDKDGRYRVQKIWCNRNDPKWGTYTVGIRHPRLVATTQEVHFASGEAKTDFDFQAVPGTLIAGKLIDPDTLQPVAGGSVEVRSAITGRRSVWTDEHGEFSCPVAPGEVQIIASQPPGGYYLVEDEHNRGKSYIATTAFGERFPVTVTTQGALHRLGSITGSITLPDGTPAANSTVICFFPNQRLNLNGWTGDVLRNVSTGKDGGFSNMEFPVGLSFGIYAESRDGKNAGFLPAGRYDASKPLRLQLQPTTTGTFTITGNDGMPLRKTSVQIRPVIDGTEVWTSEQRLTTNSEGLLKPSKLLPGVLYALSVGDYAKQRLVLVSSNEESTTPKTISLGDRFTIRLKGATGEPMKIVSFKHFEVDITLQGKPSTWTNGDLPILERRSDSEVLVARQKFCLGREGNLIRFRIETTGNAIVSATGAIPSNGSDLIEATVTEPIRKPNTKADPTIVNVGANDLAGRILDANGHPIAGATITLLNAWWRQNQPPIVTDEEGVFRIPELANKHYTCIEVFKEGFAPLWLADLSLGKGFKAQLHNTTRLRGKFSLPDGKPAGSVEIKLETDIPTSNERSFDHKITGLQFKISTDSAGDYDFPVEPGVYRYQVVAKDGGFLRGDLSIGEGEVKALPAQLQPGASATLTVIDVQTGKPIPGIPILILESTGPYAGRSKEGSERTTDEHGIARWDNLIPGRTVFEANRMTMNVGPHNEQLPYSRWWSDEAVNPWNHIDYRHNLPKKGDGDQNLVFDVHDHFQATVQMERGVEISGIVVDENGKPVSKIAISTVPEEGQRGSLTGDSRYLQITDESGAFHGYIPAGNGVVYNLCAYTMNFRADIPSPYAHPYANAVSEPFQSKPGDKFQFRLQMKKGGWATGRVVNQKGEPIPGVEVQASAMDFMDGVYGDKTMDTDAEGRFRLGPLRSGKYEIRPDTERGINITNIPGLKPAQVEIEDGKDAAVGDLVFPK